MNQYFVEFYGDGGDSWGDEWDGRWNDKEGGTKNGYLYAEFYPEEEVDILEEFNDYDYDWQSILHDIHDPRVTATYQWVSQSHDLWGKRPRYETYDTQVKVVQQKSITVWGAAPVIEQQSLIAGGRLTDPGLPRTFGGFGGASISGDSVQILAGNDVTVAAVAESRTGDFIITATADVTVDGLLPVGADANTIPAQGELRAPDRIQINAGGVLTVTPWASLTVDQPDSELRLTAADDALVSGTLDANGQVLIDATNDVFLDGPFTATDLIEVRAGNSGTQQGDIDAGPYTDLQAPVVRLISGQAGGDMSLDLMQVTATDQLELLAPAGQIEAATSLFTAPRFYARAATGLTAAVPGGPVDVELSGSGDIVLVSQNAVTLDHVVAADGGITVDAFGTIDATYVYTLGESDANDITLRTHQADPDPSDIIVRDVTASGKGDLTFLPYGRLIIDNTNGILTADSLSFDAYEPVSLNTNVNRISIRTHVPGDVSITQVGTRPLTVTDTIVLDGSLIVNNPRSNVTLDGVTLASNRDTNDVIVNAAGDIRIGWLNAGLYFTDPDDVPAEGIRSLGDVFLTAGLRVLEAGDDADVDLVADQLTISAQTGIFDLELAVNELLDVQTADRSIELHDYAGLGELAPGLVLTNVRAAQGSVTVAAEDYLEIHKVVASGEQGAARLTSTDGHLHVMRPASGDAVEYTGAIVLDAARGLESYTFFQHPDKSIEYRAGDYYDFDPATSSLGIPSPIVGESVILERRVGQVINQPLNVNASWFELQSDANVFINANVGGSIGTFAVTARGVLGVEGKAYDEATGQDERPFENQPSGYINIQTERIVAGSWEFRALREVYMDLAQSHEIVGFVGGLSGFEHTDKVWLNTPQTFTLRGGIVSADLAWIEADQIDSDMASVVLADRLEVTATRNITLSAASDVIVADSTGSGNITLNESDDVVLEHIQVNDGAIVIRAGGNLTASEVVALTDGAGKDITLKADGNIYVDLVDAGQRSGVDRKASQVTLDAYRSIREPSCCIDNAPEEGKTMVDVYAWKIHFLHGQSMPTPLLITSEADRGTGDELEIIYTDGTEEPTDDNTTMTGVSGPICDGGDCILMAPNLSGNLNLSVSGKLTIVALPTYNGQTITLNVGGDLTIVETLNVGSGTISLDTNGALTVPTTITANVLNVEADSFHLPLTTDVNTLNFAVTGAGEDMWVNAVDDITLGSGMMNGGDATIQAADLLAVGGTGVGSGAATISLISTGTGVTVNSGAELTANGQVSLTADAANGDVVVNGLVTSVNGPIVLDARDDVLFGSTGRVAPLSGNVELTADDDILMDDGAVIDGGPGVVQLVAEDEIRLGSVRTDNGQSGAIFIETAGAITDGGDSDPDLQTTHPDAVVVIYAMTGVGEGDPIDTAIDTLDLINDIRGEVQILEADDIGLRHVQQNAEDATTRIEALGTLTVLEDEWGVSAVDGLLNLIAHEDVVVESVVMTGSGMIDIVAYDNVLMGPVSRLLSGTGHVRVTADPDSMAAGGALTMADGARIDAGSGLVELTGSCSVTLGGVITTGETQVTSRFCSIVDGGDTDPEVLAARAVLRAVSGVGNAEDPLDRIETRTNGATLTLAGVTTRGDFQVHNFGPLVIGTVDGVVGLLITDAGDENDQIMVTAASPVTIDSPSVNDAGGDIIHAAQDVDEDDDLTVNANITASGGDGNIYLYAGDDIIHNAGLISVVNRGNVYLSAGEDYNSPGSPKAGNINGDVTQNNDVTIQAADGDILVEATRNVNVSILTTGGDIYITADDDDHGLGNDVGAINDVLSTEAANLIGNLGTLIAPSGIGSLPIDDQDIDTCLNHLDAQNLVSGDIVISEAATCIDCDLGVRRVAQTNPASDGNIFLTTDDGTMTIEAGFHGVSVAGSGDATLFADGGDGSHLIINDSIVATTGTLYLRADEDVRAEDAGGTVTTTSGAIEITADWDHLTDGAPTPAAPTFGQPATEGGTISFIAGADITSATGPITFDLTDYDGEINSNIHDTTGTVTKIGSGVLNLNGMDNDYTGQTNVEVGFLIVNGWVSVDAGNPYSPVELSFNVASGAVLGGTGTIGATPRGRDVIVNAGGILDPGTVRTDGWRETERLTLNGDLLMVPNAIFRAQFDGLTVVTEYDQLWLNGQIDLSGDLTATGGAVLEGDFRFPVPIGAEFRIVRNDDLNDLVDPADFDDLSDLVETRFEDLTEGIFFTLDNVLLNISYESGDGESDQTINDNDITLIHPGRFDFNASPVVNEANCDGISGGWIKADTNAMGWDPNAALPFATMSGASENRPFTADEKTPLSAVRDLHATGYNSTATFLVDVAMTPGSGSQDFQIAILSGDFYWPHDSSEFVIRDVNGAATATLTASTGRGQFSTLLFESLTVNEIDDTGYGQLAIDMDYTGDKSGWHAVINYLDIRPVRSVGEIRISRTSDGGTLLTTPDDGTTPIHANGLIVDTYQGKGAPPNSLITLASTNGVLAASDTVIDRDAYLTQVRGVASSDATHVFRSDVQVFSDEVGNFTFQMQRPSAEGDVTIWAMDASGLSLGDFVQDFSLGGPTATTTASVRRFDFGSGSSSVEPGFINVTPASQWNEADGFGWDRAGLGANHNTSPELTNDLIRDYIFGNEATFTIAADPGVSYFLRIYMADAIYGHDDIQVTFGSIDASAGDPSYMVDDTTPPFHPEGTGGSSLDRDLTGTRLISLTNDNDTSINITFNGRAGWDPNFVVNGIDIWSAAAAAPDGMAYPLLVHGGPGETRSGDLLAPEDLEPIVAEAIAQWTAFGLTAEQAAILDRVEFTVNGLGDDVLAIADAAGGISVLIDQDAAGYGWFIDATPWEDSEYTSDDEPPAGMDLLTVVLHELGHMLGLEDVSAEDHPDAVMALSVLPGQMRRLTDGPLLAGQNGDNPLDIDANGAVTPLDVLRLINHVNAHGQSLWNPRMGGSPVFADVTADGVASAADALRLINYLNLQNHASVSGGIGEGEPGGAAWAESIPSRTAGGSDIAAIEDLTDGPEASAYGSLENGPEASAFGSLDDGPEASAFGSLDDGPEASAFGSLDDGPEAGVYGSLGAVDELEDILDVLAEDVAAAW